MTTGFSFVWFVIGFVKGEDMSNKDLLVNFAVCFAILLCFVGAMYWITDNAPYVYANYGAQGCYAYARSGKHWHVPCEKYEAWKKKWRKQKARGRVTTGFSFLYLEFYN